MTTVIGCDPSVTKTGVVIRRPDGTYSSFLAVPPAKAQDPARLYWIASTVVADCKLAPEAEVLLVIEHPTPRRQLDANYPLFWRLREEFGWHYQVKTLIVWPSQLNKFATGDGKITEIGGAVVDQWGKCLPGEINPDVLDALALCKFGEAHRVFELGFGKPPDYKWMKDVQWDTISMDGTGKKRRERVAVDDHATFGICKGE
jgi:hypothetical protein